MRTLQLVAGLAAAATANAARPAFAHPARLATALPPRAAASSRRPADASGASSVEKEIEKGTVRIKGDIEAVSVATAPISGMKPGTSGLRKRVDVWQDPPYLANFVQACLDALGGPSELAKMTLVLGGDGRFFNDKALQVIVRMAAANGVARVVVGRNGLLSTPAVSAIIRSIGADVGLVLTASHNPGGPDGDFGIKMNGNRGEPAVEAVTDRIFDAAESIMMYRDVTGAPDIDLAPPPDTPPARLLRTDVVVVDSIADYAAVLEAVFDFDAIKRLLARPDFEMTFDGMHGASGPYAQRVLGDRLGCSPAALQRCAPLEDFGGIHPDPNMAYAADLVKTMGLAPDGNPLADPAAAAGAPAFGAACDGDGDRNMILGKGFFVTPSDSVAVLAAHASECIPWFTNNGGLKACARSMPTSGALDRVAAKLGVPCFETPTGWKFFGSLMDAPDSAYTPFICGEESFGTGADHVREKDGLWAVLAWLSVLAHFNPDASAPLVGVADVVQAHWAEFGRNYYARYDYEGVASDAAEAVMQRLRDGAVKPGDAAGGFVVAAVDEFGYADPVDGTRTEKQGIVVAFEGGARAVFRLSGTGSVGATVRLYLERHEPDSAKHGKAALEELEGLGAAAIELSKLHAMVEREAPTVKT